MLAQQPERRPARREDVDVRDEVEKARDVPGRRREMLEIVEEEERARFTEGVRDAVCERAPSGLPCAHRACNLREHEAGIGDGREPDEDDRPFECCGGHGLEREPALAGSARAGDRHEPDVWPGEQELDRREVLLPADEPVMKSGQRRAAERSWRGKRLGEAVRHELVEVLVLRDVLEAVASQIDRLVAPLRQQVVRQLGGEYLPTVRDRLDPGGPDDVDADVALRPALRLARVQSHAHGNADAAGPLLDRERMLRLDRGAGRLYRASKDDHERVALCVHLDPAVACERCPQEDAVLVLDVGILRAERPE